MKKITVYLLLFFPYFLSAQSIVSKWTFNTKDSLGIADATVSTGTKISQTGNGSLQLSGAVISTFSDGVLNDSTSLGDNSAIQVATFPTNGTKKDTSGIILRMNTTGYTNLFFSWYQRHSASSSKFVKLLYTIDGLTWLQYTGPGTDTTNSLYRALVSNTFIYRTADFSAVNGASNNPLFAVKIVSTFSPNGSTYIGTTSTYATSGNYRFDLIQLKGQSIPRILSPHQSSIVANFNGFALVDGCYNSLTSTTQYNEFYVATGKGAELTIEDFKCSDKQLKVFPISDNNPKILKLKLNLDSNTFSVVKNDDIYSAFRKPISGMPSAQLCEFKKEIYLTDTVSNCTSALTSKQCLYSETGFDPSGIQINDNKIWMMDAYRSAFVCLNANSKIIHKYSPFEQDSLHSIDTTLKYVQPDFGFKNLTQTPNQLLYSISSKSLHFDSLKADRIHRLIQFNPATHELKTFVYLNSGQEGSIAPSEWQVDDLTAINNEEFLVYEHAENANAKVNRITKISIQNASPILENIHTFNGKTGPLEIYLNETGLSTSQIVPVAKSIYFDLNKNGLPANFVNISGINIQNDSTLLLITNNNNGLESKINQGIINQSQSNTTKIAIVKLNGDLKLNQFQSYLTDINPLGDFSLYADAGSNVIELDSNLFAKRQLQWNVSKGSNSYRIKIDTTASIESTTLFSQEVLNADTFYQFSFDNLSQIASQLNMHKGDSIGLYYTVWSYNTSDSIPSNQTLFFYLKLPLLPEPFQIKPMANSFEVNLKKAKLLNVTWSTSKYADVYTVYVDTAKVNYFNQAVLKLKTSDTSIFLTAAVLDSLLQKLNVNDNDSILVTFNLIASNVYQKQIKSANTIQLYLKRNNQILTDFQLLSPINNFYKVSNNADSLKIKWSKSENATSYALQLVVDNKAPVIYHVNNTNEYDLNLNQLAVQNGFSKGDTMHLYLKVFSLYQFNGFNDTLYAQNSLTGKVFYELPFSPIQLICTQENKVIEIDYNQIKQSDSLYFDWTNPNGFSTQYFVIKNLTVLDSSIVSFTAESTQKGIAYSYLYDAYLKQVKIQDSVLMSCYVYETYRQFWNRSNVIHFYLKNNTSTGINELANANHLVVYPNPIHSDWFKLTSGNNTIVNIEMYNQLGNKVSVDISNDGTEILIKHNAISGVYLLKVQLSNQVIYKTLVIH